MFYFSRPVLPVPYPFVHSLLRHFSLSDSGTTLRLYWFPSLFLFLTFYHHLVGASDAYVTCLHVIICSGPGSLLVCWNGRRSSTAECGRWALFLALHGRSSDLSSLPGANSPVGWPIVSWRAWSCPRLTSMVVIGRSHATVLIGCIMVCTHVSYFWSLRSGQLSDVFISRPKIDSISNDGSRIEGVASTVQRDPHPDGFISPLPFFIFSRGFDLFRIALKRGSFNDFTQSLVANRRLELVYWHWAGWQ